MNNFILVHNTWKMLYDNLESWNPILEIQLQDNYNLYFSELDSFVKGRRVQVLNSHNEIVGTGTVECISLTVFGFKYVISDDIGGTLFRNCYNLREIK